MSTATEMMDSIKMRATLDDFAKGWAKRSTSEAEREARLDTLLNALGSYLMASERPEPVQSQRQRIAEEQAKLKRLAEADDDLDEFTPEQAKRETELDRKAEAARVPEGVVRDMVYKELIKDKRRTGGDGLPCVVLPMSYKGVNVPVQGWKEYLESKGAHYGEIELEVDPHGKRFTLKFA